VRVACEEEVQAKVIRAPRFVAGLALKGDLDMPSVTISRKWIPALAAALCLVVAAPPARAEFGISAFDQQFTSDAAERPFTQAAGHPFAIQTEIDLNSHLDPGFFNQPRPDADAKDILVDLPPGELGNPAGVAQCTMGQLSQSVPTCPTASQVGTVSLRTDVSGLGVPSNFALYNIVPPTTEPALFGFSVLGVPITLTGNVRNGGDFGVTVASTDIPIAIPLDGLTLTFWGVPADPRHDRQRCPYLSVNPEAPSEPPSCTQTEGVFAPHPDPEQPTAFLTLPGSCTPPGVGAQTKLRADSWADPGVFVERELVSHLPPGYPLSPGEWGAQQGMSGCDLIPFKPSISVTPTNTQADTPTGLNIEISLPQEGLSNPEGIATADVKKAVVTLPAGESVSPSAADGLGGCTPAEIGLKTANPATCPDSSKLGTVEIDTPVLDTPLTGSIFLGAPECGPCSTVDDLAGRLVKLYLVVEGHGVVLKLAGRVELDPVTGRIVTTFDDNPQLPFDHLKLNFKAGPRSPLVNPHTCGSFETTAEFTPWSGNPPMLVSSAFEITSGPEGKPCPSSPEVFAPSFAAGTTNNQAGAFSPFSVTFGRADGEQQLGGVTMKLPPGLLGRLSAVSLCPEPQASVGACPVSSEIGVLTVSTGAGANPFYVHGGKVFLTVGYKGMPFGLSIAVPADAGPFDLGTVVVRASIALDPVTTAITVTTDPLPTILDGIPLDLRTVNVNVANPGFIFNPTNCNPLSLTATLTGGDGGSDAATNGFQVTNCGRLGFAPKFTVTTPGKTSRKQGAGLTAKIVYPKGAQANIAKVKVSLPKQLPSRLTTLQKACADSTFQQNPGNCPAASRIGFAKAITPVLPEPLTGPAYFVSHGGAAFPDLVVALKGYGVTFNLVGTTFISKAGITSTSFKQVPDVPIDSFELTLPQGPGSALAANGNLCTSRLVMPTAFIAQDGAEIHQSTPIAATGCPKHKAKRVHGARLGVRHGHGRKGRSGK
jgi:hypothetical protein